MEKSITETGINELFQNIFQTKSTLDVIENKLDLQHKIQVYEMRAFFQNLSHEEFLNYTAIEYKGKEGLVFFDTNLQQLNKPSLSSISKDELTGIIEEIYNCFNLIFPRDRFDLLRERAAINAQNSFFDKQDRLANKVLEALGLSSSDKDYSNNKATILSLLRSREEIEKIAKDADYISQRLNDVKENLNTSENQFNRDKEKIIGKLRKENEAYKTELQKGIDLSLEELRKDIKLQRDAIKKTMDQFAVLKARLSVIDQNVYREELATFFLKEHDDIKGKIEPVHLLMNILAAFVMARAAILWLTSQDIVISFIQMIVLFIISFLGSVLILDYIIKIFFKVDKDIEHENLRGFLTPYWCWLVATLAGMGTILFKALELSEIIKENLKNNVEPLHSVLPYFGMYLILAWFTWFASKQFSYNKQICDEYEYKYALSKSYMLYKKEAESVITEQHANAVLLALLDSVIKNIAHSPVQSVKQDVHTPFSEVFKAVKDTVQHKDLDK
ncbi:MAG: hypothetical protein Q4P09_05305 [Phascolarctobacterium sp.]|nr:hypothetical protein [Phascolarctobacterium sp.]